MERSRQRSYLQAALRGVALMLGLALAVGLVAAVIAGALTTLVA
ncbi:MAG: hypothetical protein WD010_05975 [Nitriliruptor sp.]